MADYLTPKTQLPKLDLTKFQQKEPTKSTYDPKKQLEGYQKRLEASGIDPQEAMDSRNWLEKALNLTPDQNIFFDVFEILERPQQALFGAWKASQEGKDVKEAMKAGISGNDVIRFKEVLHNYGMTDSENKFGVDDVVGFLGDIFVDPIELPMLVASGGTSAIAKATTKADDAADLVKTLGKAVDAGKASKETLEAAVKASKVADKALEVVNKKRLISPIEGLFRATKKGAGFTARITDKGITKLLTKVDDLSASGVKGLDEFSKALDLAGSYKHAKKRIQQIFNAAKEIPAGVMEKYRLNIGKTKRVKEQLRILHDDLLKTTDDIFEKSIKSKFGISSDEFYETLGDAHELKNYKPTVKMKEILYSEKLDIVLDDATKANVIEFFNTYIPDILDENVYKIDDLFVESTLENGRKTYKFNDKYIPEIRSKLDELDPTFKQNKYMFEEVDDVVEETVDDMGAGTEIKPEGGRLGLREVDGDEFRKVFTNERANTPRPEYLSPPDEYDFSKGKGFLSKDGKQGIFVTDSGDIVSVFNSSKEVKGASEELILTALRNGGKRLNNFDGFLTENYAKYGFEPVAKIKFIDEFAPKGWKYDEYGRPDVVFMAHNGDSVEEVIKNKGKYKTKKVDELPYSASWDEAEAIQIKKANINSSFKPKTDIKPKSLKELDKPLARLRKVNPNIADDITKKIDILKTKNLTDEQVKALKGTIDEYISKISALNTTGNTLDVLRQKNKFTKEFNNYIDNLVETVDDLVSETTQKGELIPYQAKTRQAKRTIKEETLTTSMSLEEALELQMKSPRFYSDDEIALFEKYLADEDFSKALEAFETTQNKMFDLIDEELGSSLRKGTPEGYLRHALSKERKAIPLNKRLEFEEMVASGFKGNVNEFTGRKYRVSKREANMIYRDKIKNYLSLENIPEHKRAFWESKEGMDLFERSINSSIADFIDNAPDLVKNIKNLDDVLLGSTLTDKNLLRPITPDEKIMSTHKKVKRADITKKLKGMKKYVPEETASRFDDFIKQLPAGEDFAMDKTVYEMIGRLGNKGEISVLYQLMDLINNTFKKWKLFSPGFQMRNIMGNTSNMYLAGMNTDEIVKYINEANDVLKKAPEILKKATLKGEDALTAAERVIYRKYTNFVDKNFLDLTADVYDIRTVVKTNKKLRNKYDVLGQAADFNFSLNQKWDNRFRMAMLNWADENPAKFQRMGFGSPEEAVRHALFDPEDLSSFEKDKIKRLIPFYTFTKKNLAFQAKNIFENPRKYNHLRKTIRATWEEWADIKDTDIETYKRENFWIPIPFISKDGKYAAIKTNLPLGDLAEFVEDPGRKIMASMSPMIRAPFELATNEQIYTGMPIQEFEGQRGFLMPWMDRKVEYGISQFGLDVPMSLGSDIARTVSQGVKGELADKSGLEIARQAFGRSMVSEGSVERAQTSKSYQQLRQIQDLMKYYKQEGIDIVSLAEAENKNNSLQSLSARLKSLLK